jgi:arylsulfatase A-like enzyme
LLGWCAALLGASGLVGWRAPLTASAGDKEPSVLLVSIDTLRADAVGAYGHGARTPNLDALAAQGTLFEQAVAPSVYTGPSHAALLTGLHPATTGFRVNYAGLDASFPTLADDLGRAGFATAAFPSAWTTASSATRLPDRFQLYDEELRQRPWLPPRAGRVVLFRPFLRWAETHTTWPPYRPAGPTTDRVVAWLEDAPARPFFAWVHYFDPHLPYMPPADLTPGLTDGDRPATDGRWYALDAKERRAVAGSPEAVERMLALYAAEVRYVDREVGRVIEAARRASGGRLWIVVTADHGESMGEHGIWWNRDLYDVTLRVPLLIVPPEPPAVARVAEPVELIDVAPTLLDALGVDTGRRFDGRSLIPLIEGEEVAAAPAAHSLYTPEDSFFRGVANSIRTDRWKLIERSAGWSALDHWQEGRTELYDLWADPGETSDVAATEIEARAALAAEIPDDADPSGERRELSDEEREQLRALGYIQ